MPIPYVTDTYHGRIPINWYPTQDAEKKVILSARPGLKEWLTLGGGAMGNQYAAADGYLYAVSGGDVYRISDVGVRESIGTIQDNTAFTFITENHTQVVFSDGLHWYVYNKPAGPFSAATGTDYPSPSTICQFDSYLVITEKNTPRLYIVGNTGTTTEDATAIDLTDVIIPESFAGNLIGAYPLNAKLWVMGSTKSEVWYDSGDAAFPLSPIPGAKVETGCMSARSVAEVDNDLCWLNEHRQVVRSQGYAVKIVSTRKLEREWATYSDCSDAVGFSYVLNGHWFYQIAFPSAGKTFAHDHSWGDPTGSWHELTSAQTRHWSNCYAYFAGKHLVGDWHTGTIWEMDDNWGWDGASTEIVRQFETPLLNKGGQMISVPMLQIEWDCGYADPTGQGANPQASLAISRDGGNTWGSERKTPIGAIGEYKTRTTWYRNGASRKGVARVTMSDPYTRAMVDWHMQVAQ